MCMSDLTDHMYAGCQQRSEDDTGSLGTIVTYQLWAAKWVLETEPRSSVRTSDLNDWTNTAAPSLSDS